MHIFGSTFTDVGRSSGVSRKVIGYSEIRLSYANKGFNNFYSIFHPMTMNQESGFRPDFILAPRTTEKKCRSVGWCVNKSRCNIFLPLQSVPPGWCSVSADIRTWEGLAKKFKDRMKMEKRISNVLMHELNCEKATNVDIIPGCSFTDNFPQIVFAYVSFIFAFSCNFHYWFTAVMKTLLNRKQ